VEKIESVKKWSIAIMINHWTMALAVFVLIATGFYIADPLTIYEGETVSKFSMGNFRFWHILFGVLLTFLFIWRIYLAFFSRFRADWKDFLAWTHWDCTYRQIRFYLLIDKEAPQHEECYGPMQSLAYLGLMFMVLFIVITGLILMGANYQAGLTGLMYKILRPVENLMGGLAVVRYAHHIVTWFFILFIVVHVYMAFWYDAILKEGTVSSMISGRLFEKAKE
jgi:Ni/Fe-hydrogenase 1 B-type cytochrome subunit